MSENITLLPDKLAEREKQFVSRVAIIARKRFEHTRAIDRLDEELIGLEARLNEIGVAESNYTTHVQLEEARKGDGEANDDSQKG